MKKLLIVDDNEEIRAQLSWGLAEDYSFLAARTAMRRSPLSFKESKPTVATLDLGLSPDKEKLI